jgi:hypothetical protein
VLRHWKQQNEADESFANEQKIALPQLINFWETKPLQPENDERLIASMKTKFGIIQMAMKLLEEEKLVRVHEYQVSALEPLYERLEQLYHNQQRYNQLRTLILEVK